MQFTFQFQVPVLNDDLSLTFNSPPTLASTIRATTNYRERIKMVVLTSLPETKNVKTMDVLRNKA